MANLTQLNWFLMAWALIGLAGAIFFRLPMAPLTKQKRLNNFHLSVPALFLIACFVETRDWTVLFILMPPLFLITLINSRVIKVCQKCGALQYGNTWKLSPPEICGKCGSKFNPAKE